MSQNETDPSGLNQHQAGAKLDAGKIDMSLLTLWPRALREVCRVGTLGAQKYSRGGFLQVSNGVIRYTAAMLRHLFKESYETYDVDPFYDTQEGLAWKGTIRHDAQVAWNALSRLEVKLIEEEKQHAGINKISEQSIGSVSIKPGNIQFIRSGESSPVSSVGSN